MSVPPEESPDSTDQAIAMSNLTLDADDLPALDEMHQVLAQTPDGLDRAKHSSNHLQRPIPEVGKYGYLEAGLQNSQAAVTQTPDGNHDLAGYLKTLGDLFTYCFQRSGKITDLDNALKNFQEAIAQTAEGDLQVLPCFAESGSILHVKISAGRRFTGH
ncbi:hypothetical protein FB451DRAFT_199082 [Mycena latifolia]|nr:hypothetical protein FB451DRAFT_199082 [Mycena latifolia]